MFLNEITVCMWPLSPTCTYFSLYVCISVCMCVCTHACTCACMRACMLACMSAHVCTYVCMYVCMYVYFCCLPSPNVGLTPRGIYNPNACGSYVCRGSNKLLTRTLYRYTRAGLLGCVVSIMSGSPPETI